MRVSCDIKTTAATPGADHVVPAAPTLAERDTAEFPQAVDLNSRLQAIPDTREQAIERGKELIQEAAYPPPYAILRLARLLAIELSIDAEP